MIFILFLFFIFISIFLVWFVSFETHLMSVFVCTGNRCCTPWDWDYWHTFSYGYFMGAFFFWGVLFLYPPVVFVLPICLCQLYIYELCLQYFLKYFFPSYLSESQSLYIFECVFTDLTMRRDPVSRPFCSRPLQQAPTSIVKGIDRELFLACS